MGVSLLLACLVSFNVYRLGKLTLDRESDRLWAYLAANVLIFSPVQLENWLQGQQLIYFFPIACLSTCLVIATAPRLRFATKCIACAALSIISTFSSVNGILCWLLVLPVLWTWSSAKTRSKRALAVGWLVAVGLSAILYLYGYRQVHHASPSFGFAPAQAAFYFFNVVGRPLTLLRFVLAPVIGLGIVVMFIWACGQFLRSLNSPIDSQRRLVWLVIGAYFTSDCPFNNFRPIRFRRSPVTEFALYDFHNLPTSRAGLPLHDRDPEADRRTRVHLEHRFATRADCGDRNNTGADAALLSCCALCERSSESTAASKNLRAPD